MSAAEIEESVHQGDADSRGRVRSPWAWVITANYAEGLQNIAVTQLLILVFFTMGMDKGTTALWVGALALPWTVKPLWGPLVDKYWTKRNWTIWMQMIVGVCFLLSAFTLQLRGTSDFLGSTLPAYFIITVGIMFFLALAGATHDIACDGYYMLALREKQQAFFVGIRSTAFRLAWITATGLLLFAADYIQSITGPTPVDVKVAVVVPGSSPPTLKSADEEVAHNDGGPQILVAPVVQSVDQATTSSLDVRLSSAPESGKEFAVILRFTGSEGVVSIDKSRLVFTEANWDKPQTVVISPSSSLRRSDRAELRISAGDVPLSWAFVMVLCGVYYVLASLWHRYAMPYPHSDWTDTKGRPPFIVPLLCIIVGIVGPFFVCRWFYGQMDVWFGERLHTFVNEHAPKLGTEKGWKFFFGVSRLVAIVAILGCLIKIRLTRRPLAWAFFKLSEISKIGFADVFVTFFDKSKIWITLGFLLTFRLGESQLAVIKGFFLIDARNAGGLELSLTEAGWANSLTYVLALICGGLLGGWLISRFGLRKLMWVMVAAMHLPNLVYVYLGANQPTFLPIIHACIGFESFWYGFGFTSYMMVMILTAQGPYKTAHYALCTGFMALGAMIPSMMSGFIQELAGYENFFWLVLLFCIPGTIFVPFLPIDPNFGRKST